jgi:hypothetical protein
MTLLDAPLAINFSTSAWRPLRPSVSTDNFGCAPQLFAPRQIQLISRSSIRRRSAPSNIHDAVHLVPTSRAQRHLPPVDGGISLSEPIANMPGGSGTPGPRLLCGLPRL